MTDPLRFRVSSVEVFERPVRLRLPFRFGVVTLTEAPQAFVRVAITMRTDKTGIGMAAELMVPKWFDKNPELTNEENAAQLRRSLQLARGHYVDGSARTAFGHFVAHHGMQLRTAQEEQLNALVAAFGPALIDRAIIDALGRALGASFYDLARTNALGLHPHATLTPDIVGFDFDRFLAGLTPSRSIGARHTVGLLDPLTDADLAQGAPRPDDNLPVTLEEVIATYGHRWFKLKVCGDLTADLRRLERIAAVLASVPEYRATLDGNEQYQSAEAVLELWRKLQENSLLAQLADAVAYVEQPIARARTFDEPVGLLAAERSVIIDEADAPLDAFPRAVALGYSGVSSKTCKGVYRSLINAARAAKWNEAAGATRYFLSGEDLTTQAGLAVQQDLALVSLLGLTHVERNGHHYVDGFGGAQPNEADAFHAAHPDLYSRASGRIRLAIREGRIALGSLDQPGFGSGAHPIF